MIWEINPKYRKYFFFAFGTAGLGVFIFGLFYITLVGYTVSGVAFEDINGNGARETGEGGLSARTVALAQNTLFESVDVVVNDASGINTVNPLVNGRKYLFVASGEWNGCDNPWWCGLADGSNDTEYQAIHRSEWPTHDKDGTLGYVGSSINQGDLMINDTFVEWGPYRNDHVYGYVFTGTGGVVNFSVMDGLNDVKIPAFYGDNSFLGIPPGEHLKVDIYELVQGITNPVTTNANGNYAFSNVPNGDYQIFELQIRGWIPTNPANGAYDVTVAGADIGGKDFGSQEEGRRFDVSKTVVDLNGGDFMPGDEAEYTIFFDNIAPVKYLYGVYFTDVLPSGLTYVPASAAILNGSFGGKDCVSSAGTFSVVGGTLSASWDSYTDPFAPGKSACFRFRATINGDVPTDGTMITNHVDVTTLDAGAGTAETTICVPFCLQRRNWPTNYSISVNNDEPCTDSPEVSLTLRAEAAKFVVVSNRENFFGAEWEFFTNPMIKNWTLEDGDGTKTVYAIFKSLDGNLSFPVPISDTIELRQDGCKPEPPPPPEEETPACSVDCQKVTYDLYIINPDGSRRDVVGGYARMESLGDGKVLFNFEDKGSDWDFNDIVIKVDRNDCNKIVISPESIDAGWHHQIGIALFYDGVFKNDLLLWPDSHLAVGESKVVNVDKDANLCSGSTNF